MGIPTPSFRRTARAGLSLVLLWTAFAALGNVLATAQSNADCPAIIASLLPTNGSIRGGQ